MIYLRGVSRNFRMLNTEAGAFILRNVQQTEAVRKRSEKLRFLCNIVHDIVT